MALHRFGDVRIVDSTPTLGTGGVDAGDVLAETTQVEQMIRETGRGALLTSLVIVDDDDVGGDLNIVLFDSNVALGTADSAPSISDADADQILGIVNVATYVDLGGVKIATVTDINIPLRAVGDWIVTGKQKARC